MLKQHQQKHPILFIFSRLHVLSALYLFTTVNNNIRLFFSFSGCCGPDVKKGNNRFLGGALDQLRPMEITN